MSCYVSQQLICLGISSVFCNLHCRTLLCICTKLFFFTLIRKVCSNQSPAETWMELQGSAAVPGVGAVFAALPLYRALPPQAGYPDIVRYLRSPKVPDTPRDTGHPGPWCVSPQAEILP